MDPKELMIGNYVGYNSHKSYYINKIKTINTNSVTFENGIVIKYKNLIPVPLTEQWLIDFGFEKKRIDYKLTHSYHYQNEFCWIYLIRGGFEIELITGNERFNMMKVYNYVHQLQNIIFTLTGKQLTK